MAALGMQDQLSTAAQVQASRLGKSLSRPVVLVGLMGAGKTTIGRRLAKALNWHFVDSDAEIEEAASMSIAEIFEQYGEAEFRAVERRVIARLMQSPHMVLATGGGAYINAETRALLRSESQTIWLDADIDTLVERTSRRDSRPLLRQGNPAEILRQLANKRNPIYAEADIRVPSVPGPHHRVVEDILMALAKQLEDIA